MNKTFTIKRFLIVFSIFCLVGISTVTLTYTGGAPAARTNAPGESNCTAGCHSTFALQTSGTNYNNISLTSNFTGNGYIPDSTYTITLSYTHTGKSKFGYQLTCLDSNDNMAGSFSLVSGNSKSAITSASVSGGMRSYMNHTSSGTSGSGGNTWSFEWTAPSSNVGDVTFYTIVNSANSAGGNSGDIIIAREFNLSPSSLLPVATASANPLITCAGSSVSLSGAGTNTPTSWSWNMPNGTPNTASTQNTSTIFSFPGTYFAILEISNAKGVSIPDTVTIIVRDRPSAFITGGNHSICSDDSVLLSVPHVSGNSYLWNNGETTREIWAKDAGVYYILVTSSNGCDRLSNNIFVTHKAKPNVTLSSNATVFGDTLCIGASAILEASSSTFDSFYFFQNDQILDTLSVHTYTTSLDSTSVFGLQVRDSNNCLSDMATYTVIGSPKDEAPVVSCNATSPSSILYNWTSPSAHAGFQVSKNRGATWSSPSSGSLGLSHEITGLQPEDSTTLWVRALDGAPCFYSAVGTATCISDTCNQLEVETNFASAICKGDLWTVEVNGLSNEWYSLSLDQGGTFTDTLFSFNPNSTRTYILNVTDSANLVCPAAQVPLEVQVDVINDIQLKADKVGQFCEGETVTFTANDSIDNFDFYWNAMVAQSGASNTYINDKFKHNDSVYVIVTKGVCTDTSQKIYISVEPPADASFTFSRDGSVYTFVPTVATHSLYTWDFGDGSATSSDVSPMHDFANAEGSTVVVKLDIASLNNCAAESRETVTLPNFSSISEMLRAGIHIYPNPVDDVLYIRNESGNSVQVKVLNLIGATVYTTEVYNGVSSIDVSMLSAGTYTLFTTIAGKSYSQKLLKK